jgi:hypothetical protein
MSLTIIDSKYSHEHERIVSVSLRYMRIDGANSYYGSCESIGTKLPHRYMAEQPKRVGLYLRSWRIGCW